MSAEHTIIFTDGAAKGNPGPGGWGTIIATPDGIVTEMGGGAAHTTNNKMELTAAIRALSHIQGLPGKVIVYTDSTYLIRGITQWIHGWRRKGWKTAGGGDVLNRDHWERLHRLTSERGSAAAISWCHVSGHAGIPGNERADAIAVAYASGVEPELYRGPAGSYGIDLDSVESHPLHAKPATGTQRGAKKGPAYSYLSLVGGQLMRHRTWAECERRVKGQSGARFKKALDAAHERSILEEWGLPAGALARER